MEERRFYVYEWYIEDTDEVFYVGKGTGNRLNEVHNRNKYFNNVYNKYKCLVRKVQENLTNEEACELERKQIAKRREMGEAYCNFTEGGTGFSTGKLNPNYRRKLHGPHNPFYGRKHTEETKRKISESRKGKGGRKGEDNPMYGKGFKGKDNPMYGKTGFKHHNHKKIRVTYKDSSVEYLTSKECERKFGIAFTRIRKTGGILTYKKQTPNKDLYEGTKIELI